MIRKLPLLLLLLLPFLPAAAAADALGPPGLEEVVAALERPFQATTPAAEAIRDFQGAFLQESRLASLDRLQRGRGRVAVRFDRAAAGPSPRTLFHWEYLEPSRQEIVSDGRTLWVYLPENRQVIRSEVPPPGEAEGEDPMAFLTGLGNLSRDFSVAWGEPRQDAEGNYLLELTPRRPSTVIRRLLILVDRDAVLDYVNHGRTGGVMPILSTAAVDPQENTTTIEFRELQINTGLPDDRFQFVIPPDVEVIRPADVQAGF